MAFLRGLRNTPGGRTIICYTRPLEVSIMWAFFFEWLAGIIIEKTRNPEVTIDP